MPSNIDMLDKGEQHIKAPYHRGEQLSADGNRSIKDLSLSLTALKGTKYDISPIITKTYLERKSISFRA